MSLKRLMIWPDSHIPYHDKRAFKLVHKVAKDFKPDTIVLQGDFADFFCVSSHSKNPNRRNNLESEVEAVNAELDKLDALGAREKIYVSGNHEDRLERYLMDKAPELFNVVKIPQLFNLKERGWKYVPYKSDTRVGKLNLTHDCGSAGRNAIFNALGTYQHNIAIGHTHRLAYIVEGNAHGETHVGASFGWLGDAKQADYMHRVRAARDWAQGFGIGYLDTNTGTVYLVPVPIINYTVVVEGKQYRG